MARQDSSGTGLYRAVRRELRIQQVAAGLRPPAGPVERAQQAARAFRAVVPNPMRARRASAWPRTQTAATPALDPPARFVATLDGETLGGATAAPGSATPGAVVAKDGGEPTLLEAPAPAASGLA